MIKFLKLSLFCCLLNIGAAKAQKPTIQEVADYIYSSDILHPEIVLKQAILETGWFKSHHMMKKNNLFGFRGQGAYLTFESWQKSIDYYFSWQQKRYNNEKEDYYSFLVRIKYASSNEYIRHLKNIKLRDVIIPEG